MTRTSPGFSREKFELDFTRARTAPYEAVWGMLYGISKWRTMQSDWSRRTDFSSLNCKSNLVEISNSTYHNIFSYKANSKQYWMNFEMFCRSSLRRDIVKLCPRLPRKTPRKMGALVPSFYKKFIHNYKLHWSDFVPFTELYTYIVFSFV